jgi:hypothetical protein
MRLYAPHATGVKGIVRSEHTPDRPADLIPLADASHIPYPVDSTSPVTVTERERIEGPRRTIPASDWTLEKEAIRLHKPATPGHIYEVIYTSADPPVAGLGPAAIRDVITYLKRDHKYAIAFGSSQSGLFLRGYLYEGFNRSEDGRKVFDGIFAHIAGARRATFQRFVQLSRTAGPLRNASLSTTEQFPFADLDQKDHLTGKVDGILQRARTANVMPKVFYTNSAYEYWGSGASLIHTTTDGKRDHPIPPTTRIYLFAGGQHGPSAFPPSRGRAQNLANFNDYKPSMRALLAHLQAWVAEGKEPPPSAYPTVQAHTLTPLAQYAFPATSGLTIPTRIHTPSRLDFGSKYTTAGIITVEPPRVLGHWTSLVPQAGPDGNDLAGIRMPEVACSLGAFTGWNLRGAAAGASDTLLANTGSFIPLGSALRPDYAECIDRETQSLVTRTLLLPADAAAVREASLRHASIAGTTQNSRATLRNK